MQTALVTGAATGIGSAIARRLAADGFAIAVADVDGSGAEVQAAALREAGHEAQAFVADIAVADDVDRLAREVLARFGRIDVLVNNAGITGPHGVFAAYDRALMRRVIEVDLVGTLLVTQAVLPAMLERGVGRIVNLASIAGKDGNPNLAPYAAAKGGVIAFTKSLARELAPMGILVHAIAPGAVGGTSISRSAGTAVGDAGAQRASVLASTPLGRIATPEEVAALASWLCSPDCSYTTGAVHDISGGRATY